MTVELQDPREIKVSGTTAELLTQVTAANEGLLQHRPFTQSVGERLRSSLLPDRITASLNMEGIIATRRQTLAVMDAMRVSEADGQEVKVESMSGLVGLAQKGVHADRRLTELGNERATALSRVAALEGEAKEKAIEWEELLVSAPTDEDAAEKMREALGPLESKEAREGARAKDELKERDEADAARAEADEKKAWEDVYASYAQDTKDLLGSEKGKADYPMLRETDIPRIQAALFQTSESYREILTRELVAKGQSQEEAEGIAAAEAARWLTEEHSDALTRVLKTMNADFAGRVPLPESPNGESPDPDPSKADAAQHNARIDKKLEQRKGQTMQGSGTPPSGQAPVDEAELEGNTNFEKRMSAIDRVFEDFKETGQT